MNTIIIINNQSSNIFKLSNGLTIDLKHNIPFILNQEQYDLLIKEYGCFFLPRVKQGIYKVQINKERPAEIKETIDNMTIEKKVNTRKKKNAK